MYLNRSFSLSSRCIALFCACFLFLTAVDLAVPNSESRVFDGIIRLHVVANSDEADDQRVKLLVRDAIIGDFSGSLSSGGDLIAVSKEVEADLGLIASTAEAVLAREGMGYGANAVFVREYYPEREYEGFRLPAGEYYSLKVTLGNASGANWWCVLFPPLCFGAGEKSFSAAGIDGGSSRVFTEKRYFFRFKLLELFG